MERKASEGLFLFTPEGAMQRAFLCLTAATAVGAVSMANRSPALIHTQPPRKGNHHVGHEVL
jgi:hypothetical protein